jgi:malate synthase
MAKLPKGVEILAKMTRNATRLLTPEALSFLAGLHRAFNAGRRIEAVAMAAPDFRVESASIRDGAWKAAQLPRDLLDLRAVIQAGTDRRSVIAALNSGARVCIADFADMTVPSWDNLVDGQINLMDRWTSAMEHIDAASGKRTALGQKAATLMVRPRGLDLDEGHVRIDGKAVAAGLFDAGLYLFHNARTALAKASGPYLCLPRIGCQAQARLWNDIIIRIQSDLALPLSTIRVVAMLDALSPVFEVDEIAFELRDHLAALSLCRWSYARSFIGISDGRKAVALPDRGALAPLHEAVSGLLIKTAHRRGCLAIGGTIASAAGRSGAERAVRAGHDGVLTTNVESVAAAVKVFNDDMPTANQIYVTRDDVSPARKDLIAIPVGVTSEAAFRQNIRMAFLYIESWLRGRGSVSIDGSVEDAASADFRWAQVWQGCQHGIKLDTGRKMNEALVEECLAEEIKRVKVEIGDEAYRNGRFKEAIALFRSLCLAKDLAPSFTVSAARKLA